MKNTYENSIGLILGSTLSAIHKMVNQILTENNIPVTINQIILLFMLNNNKASGTIQQDIAELMGKDKSAILRTTDILEKKNIVKRKKYPNDRRKKIVVLTKKGEEVLNNFIAIESLIADRLRKNISKTDYSVMLKVIMQIKKNASE
jgi:DNA-binding MarR family transcriptional regulator